MPVLKAKIGGSWIPVGAAASVPVIPVQSAAFTPTWGALAVGTAGINVGRYVFVGGTTVGSVGQLTLSTYIKFGTSGQTFPNGPSLNILALGFNVWPSDDAIGTQGEVVGGCRIIDATPAATYIGFMRVTTLNALRPVVINAAATYTTEVLPSTTIPMTWAANDEMACSASLMAIRV